MEIENNEESCFGWIIYEIFRLILLTLIACLTAMFIFTLIFYVFNNYWIEQSWFNWENDTNLTRFNNSNEKYD